MNEHLMFNPAVSGTYPAWTTPDQATPVMSCNFNGKRALMLHDDTGSTIKDRKFKSQGAVNASGTIQMKGYPEGLLPWVFRSFLTDAAQAAAGSGWDNDLLAADTLTQLLWFSMQKKYSSAVAENAKGCVIRRIQLSCRGGEDLQVTLDFVVEDVSRAGQTWSDGTTASPAVIASVPYPATIPAPLKFHEGAIIFGGTAGLSTNKMTITTGTTVALIKSFTLEINLNTEGQYTIRDGAPTINHTRHGHRAIVFTAEVDWAALGTAYYDDMFAANEQAVRLEFSSDAEFDSGQPYEMFVTVPRMVWPEDGAPFPPLDGALAPKNQALRLLSMEHASLAHNLGVSIQSPDDLVP